MFIAIRGRKGRWRRRDAHLDKRDKRLDREESVAYWKLAIVTF
jgi:hypothetical protein